MQKINHFIDINPAAEADILSMNVVIKADENYIDGVEFTHSEVMDDGSVQFFYCCPDGLTPEQEFNVNRLIKSVYDDFTASRHALG